MDKHIVVIANDRPYEEKCVLKGTFESARVFTNALSVHNTMAADRPPETPECDTPQENFEDQTPRHLAATPVSNHARYGKTRTNLGVVSSSGRSHESPRLLRVGQSALRGSDEFHSPYMPIREHVCIVSASHRHQAKAKP
jgi:hypothetical protein